MSKLLTFILFTVTTATITATPRGAVAVIIYSNGLRFAIDAGVELRVEGFEDVPLNPAGFGAFSNAQTFMDGSFWVDSLTVRNDIALSPSGLNGAFQVHAGNRPQGSWVSPAGMGNTGAASDDDDVRITFLNPVRAFGVFIIENKPENGEIVEAFANDGSLIASTAMPGATTGNGGDGFVGFILEPDDASIKRVDLYEGSALNDDIGFDDVSFVVSPLPVITGDYNEDGTVDAADYTVWRDNLEAPLGTLPNDPTGLPIGQEQYDVWKDNFGMTAGAAMSNSANTVVPEPAAAALLIYLAIAATWLRTFRVWLS